MPDSRGLRSLRRARPRVAASDAFVAFARLDDLLTAGLSPIDALAAGAGAGGRAGAVLARIASLVARGRSLSDAFARAGCGFAPPDLALLAAGERAGALPTTTHALRRRLVRLRDARRKLVRALAYPAVLVAATLALALALGGWVVPAIAGLYAASGAPLPPATRALLAASDMTARYGGGLLLAGIAVAAALLFATRVSTRARLGVDAALFRLPGIGAIVVANARAELYELLAVLLSAGVELDRALELALPACPNRALRTRFTRVGPALRRGRPLSAAIAATRIPQTASDADVLRAAEAGGSYATALTRLAAAAAVARDERIELLARALEPAAVCMIAALVAGTVLAIYQPILGSAALLTGGMP